MQHKLGIGLLGKGLLKERIEQACLSHQNRSWCNGVAKFDTHDEIKRDVTYGFCSDIAQRIDVVFVSRYHKLIPTEILRKPPLGVVGFHYSDLPKYRGYYPINQAILHGETQIGVSMFFMDEGIDTGKIIDKTIISIKENETVEEIYRRCDDIALELFERNMPYFTACKVPCTPQVGEGSVFTEDQLPYVVDLTQDPLKIHNTVRARSGMNQCRAYIEQDGVRVFFDKTTLMRMPKLPGDTE